MADPDSGFNPMAGLTDEFLERYRRGERPRLAITLVGIPSSQTRSETCFPPS